MADQHAAGAVPPAPPMQIGPTQLWAMICGAAFGGVTLIGFFALVMIAGSRPDFICNAYTPLAAVFAFGAALSAGFIGGAASLTGGLGTTAKDNALAFSAGGGIAVLFIGFFAFIQFKNDVCNQATKMTSEDTVVQQFLKKHGVSIVTNTTKSEAALLNVLLLSYNSATRGKEVKLHPNNDLFEIPAGDLLEADPGIVFGYDDNKMPAELVGREPVISIERLEYKCNPPQIRLFVTFPHPSLAKPAG